MTYHRDRPDVPRAACEGKADLFESADTEDHIEARLICDACPMRTGCLDEAARVAEINTKQFGRSMLVGTWGGRLFGRAGHNPFMEVKPAPTPRAPTTSGKTTGPPSRCEGCDEPMVPRGVQDAAAVKYAARGLCETCYQRARAAEREAAA